MKLSTLLSITAFALMCLLLLQAFWLYYTYQLHSDSIKESINSIFHQTIEKEMDQRFLELEEKIKGNLSERDIHIASFKIDISGLENKSVVSQQFDIFQQLMVENDIKFNITNGDSIFHTLLQSNNYYFNYKINYMDSTGKIIDTTGQEIISGFQTDILSVINGERVYAVVKITPPAVFKNMLVILIASILIFFFIIACLLYTMKIFINQHQLNQLRENFIHALTHEMKTPLSTIHSVLDQFEKGKIDKDPDLRQKFCSIAIDKVIDLQNTVNQILTLAYIQKKQLTLNIQSVDLPLMIQSLIEEFKIKTKKPVRFQIICDLKDSVVSADSFYLNKVISNLIDNAIKYSNESVKIEIECFTEEKQVYIRIKDDGLGIPHDDQLKIFKRFERGAEIRRNKVSGFGIGLNYAQQVIEAHGGNISVTSQEGIGSEFIISLPA